VVRRGVLRFHRRNHPVDGAALECLPFLDRQREPARSRSPGQVVRLHLRDVVAEPLEGSAYVAREARLDGDDWNDMRRRDLEGNMLEIDDRLIS